MLCLFDIMRQMNRNACCFALPVTTVKRSKCSSHLHHCTKSAVAYLQSQTLLAGLQIGLQNDPNEALEQLEDPADLMLSASGAHAKAHAAAATAAVNAAAAATAAEPAAQLDVSPEQRQFIRRSLSNSIAGERAQLLLIANAQDVSGQARLGVLVSLVPLEQLCYCIWSA